jgi:hypothetical protein
MHRYGQTYTAITNPLDVMVKWFAIKRERIHLAGRNLSVLPKICPIISWSFQACARIVVNLVQNASSHIFLPCESYHLTVRESFHSTVFESHIMLLILSHISPYCL